MTYGNVQNVLITWLLGATIAGDAAPFDPSGERRYPSILSSVPPVPLSLLEQGLVRNRRLAFDLHSFSKWMNEGATMQCDYQEDVLQEGKNGMDCVIVIDDVAYEMVESCSMPEDNKAVLDCDICIDSQDGTFAFCYAVHCDYSILIQGASTSMNQVQQAQAWMESCRCSYATLDGQKCNDCELCPYVPSAKGETLADGPGFFTNLYLDCPNKDLITSTCENPSTESITSTTATINFQPSPEHETNSSGSGLVHAEEQDPLARKQKKPSDGLGKLFITALLCIVIVVAIYPMMLGRTRRSDSTGQNSSGIQLTTPPMDAIIT